jgi:hypothetical protein
MFDDIAQNGDVLFAILRHASLLARTSPFYRLQSIAAFRRAQRFFRELIELHAMPELFVQQSVNIERDPSQAVNGSVSAQNFQIKTVAIVGDDVCELLEFGDERERVVLKPAAKSLLLIPGNRHGQPERANVRPTAIHFTGKF